MKILVHYGEIGLKGKNRPDFENKLVSNINESLESDVKKEQGRIIVQTESKDAMSKLSRIFGIEWFAQCTEVDNSLESITEQSIKELKEEKTFKVDCSRSYKNYPLTSMEVNSKVGESILDCCNTSVSLKSPEKTVYIEIDKDKAYVFSEKMRGMGGLPIGSSGKVLSLLSGGIDSPVSSLMMMKRGCSIDYLHIHSLRNKEEVQDSKISEIYGILKEYSPKSKLYIAPYLPFESVTRGGKYDLVIFRRFMMRIAQKLAQDIGAQALITGESVGQVASQTLENMSCIDSACKMPILRPLVGMNKEEIISLSKNFGLYNASIKHYKDCCSLIMKHPATRSKADSISNIESQYNIEEAEKSCFDQIEVLE